MIWSHGSQFGVQVELHPHSERERARAFGMFRFWVNGVPFGKSSSDSTCLGGIIDGLERRCVERGTFVSSLYSSASAEYVLAEIDFRVWRTSSSTEAEYATLRQVRSEASRLLLAPTGDEAFDDGSFIVQLDVADRVRTIAALRYYSDADDEPGINRKLQVGRPHFHPIFDVSLDANEVYELFSEVVEWANRGFS